MRTLFREGLKQLGWAEDVNIRFDVRWAGEPSLTKTAVAEILALGPDVILANGSGVLSMLQQQTRTTPIVFVQVFDPVAGGFVTNLAKPGGNVTGFVNFEYETAGKWMALLREITPNVSHVGVIHDPLLGASAGLLGAVQAVGAVLAFQLNVFSVHNAVEIDQTISALAREPNAGLVVLPGQVTTTNYEQIVALAKQHQLPAIYPYRFIASAGGLVSYGPEPTEEYRKAASYIDRILRGENPGELPVQAPTKFELVINLKTAKALGIPVPPSLLARADDVIE
jgi:putative ABC transport system substrate-binding protein